MTKKIALAAFLAVPGSFAILALACLHPGVRRALANAAGLEPMLANLSRHVVLLALVYHLNLHHRHGARAWRACRGQTGALDGLKGFEPLKELRDCDAFAG
ncbi:hypothetical protein [Pandoraea pulmonicola]|uniref:Uncharacterized protein n=1 Tax=Pandoraea pulmonicola TaxID=93221 RepID=A0AAJ4ZFG6_PANPU|nr:hypothetical protein [Pandoraea pulmonicola]AJC19595.1 hypothetical protein RO07_02250 [Pandoraea pulmonicola]SUA92313.1 Uncharacterised protein [Pandoraea pulmonicola]